MNNFKDILFFLRDVIRGWKTPVVFETLHNLRPVDRCKALVAAFFPKYYGTSDATDGYSLNFSLKV